MIKLKMIAIIKEQSQHTEQGIEFNQKSISNYINSFYVSFLSYIPYNEYIFQVYKYKSQFIYIAIAILVILCCLCHLYCNFVYSYEKMKWNWSSLWHIDNTLTNIFLLPMFFWCIYGIIIINFIQPLINFILDFVIKLKIILISTLIQCIIFWICAIIISTNVSNELTSKIHFIFLIFFICLFTVNACAPPYKIIGKKNMCLKIEFINGKVIF